MSQIEEVLNGQDLINNSELYRLRQAEVAKINEHKWYESERVGHDIGFIQAEFDWMINKDNSVNITCTPEALARYTKTIEYAPLYPFPYYSMAICLQKQNSQQWKIYMQKAFEILSRTTLIPNHHTDHDWLMQKVTKFQK